MTVVGFIGLGAMGSQLARHTLQAGLPVHVHDLDPEAVAMLAAQGAVPEPDAESMAGHCAWVVTSLPRADALDDVVMRVRAGRGPQLRGVIEVSTFAVAEKERAAAVLAQVGIALVDAPLSGTSQQAAQRDLVAYVSGTDEACAGALPVIETFTRAHYMLGRLGNGMRMKLVANLLVAVHNVAAAEALVFAARAGLDLATVVRAVGDGAGSSRMFEVRGPLMARGDFAATMRVDNFVKDVDIIEAAARAMGVDVPLLHQSARLYRELLSDDLGHLDTAAVFDVLDRRAVAPDPQPQ